MLPQATGAEAAIVHRLGADSALSLSLVAEDGAKSGRGLIGPVAVLPLRHGEGIGSALMTEAILRLRAGCKGAALVGDPGYLVRVRVQGIPRRPYRGPFEPRKAGYQRAKGG